MDKLPPEDQLEALIQGLTGRQSLEEGMEFLATDLLDQYGTRLGFSFPPVQPKKIAKLRKVKRILEKHIAKPGSLTPVEGGFYILLRKSDSKRRRDFSCAHEIGHTFFFDVSREVPEPIIKFGNTEKRVIENLCDIFAESLLMPRRHFLSSWQQFEKKFDFTTLEKIGRTFQTSIESVIVRAMRLGALKNPQRFILSFVDRASRKTGLHKKLRVKLAIIPGISPIFVPSNISAERLGLKRLLTFYKNNELMGHKTVETISLKKRSSTSQTFKDDTVLCSAKYKRYGERYLLGLFELEDTKLEIKD